jgi:hypothetical protein
MPVEVTERLKIVVVNSQFFGGEYVPVLHQRSVELTEIQEMPTNEWSTITRSKVMLNYDPLTAGTFITLPDWCLNLEDI